jgi:hypothetical protein
MVNYLAGQREETVKLLVSRRGGPSVRIEVPSKMLVQELKEKVREALALDAQDEFDLVLPGGRNFLGRVRNNQKLNIPNRSLKDYGVVGGTVVVDLHEGRGVAAPAPGAGAGPAFPFPVAPAIPDLFRIGQGAAAAPAAPRQHVGPQGYFGFGPAVPVGAPAAAAQENEEPQLPPADDEDMNNDPNNNNGNGSRRRRYGYKWRGNKGGKSYKKSTRRSRSRRNKKTRKQK